MPSDYFVQSLTCPFCGTSYADVPIHTRVQDEPAAQDLRVGDRVVVVREDLTSSAPYLPVRPLGPGRAFQVLEAWECRNCRKLRWAEVRIAEDDVVESIRAVKLTPEVLDTTHLITRRLTHVFEGYIGVPLFAENSFLNPYRADFLELLRKHVSETPE